MMLLIQSAGRDPTRDHRVARVGSKIAMVEGREDLLPLFTEYMAKVFQEKLAKAIRTQRFSYRWAPLTPGYVLYKRHQGLSPNTWESSGVLVNSIIWKKINSNTFFVGIDPSKKYPGSSVTVHYVARCMEYGTKNMPARPLFRPVTTDITKNIRRYWDAFMREVVNDQYK